MHESNSQPAREIFCCPACKGTLHWDKSPRCEDCGAEYVSYGNVPVLVSAANPIFASSDLSTMEAAGFRRPLLHRLGKWIPSPSLDVGRRQWHPRFIEAIGTSRSGRCLIIGAGDDTRFVAELRQYFARVIVSDVVLAPGVDVVCDGSDLPFKDGSVDCIFSMAVLEHVLEPATVVSEMNRVLRVDGLVIADTPFMQPVHMRQYDFTRFTDLGYRWLFRSFDEIARGVSVGPASGLVWSVMYVCRSFGWSRTSSLVLSTLARLAFFWLKYLDLVIARRPSARDAAAGLFFIGRKKGSCAISPKGLLDDYSGY